MTTSPMTASHRLGFIQNVLAIAVLASLAAGCSQSADEDASSHAPEASATSSSAGLPAGRLAAGEQLANVKGAATGQSCIDCHGADGNEPIDPSYPKLGGQYADYLGHTLQAYRDGDREHVLMASQAAALTDQQIADLAVYFASRESELVTLHGMHDKD